MAKHKYRIPADQAEDSQAAGFLRSRVEAYGPGAEVEADLTAAERKALLAAGWLEDAEELESEPKKKGG